MDSNWTLRFPRTSREAYGYDVEFDRRDPNKNAWVLVIFGFGLLLGFLL